MRVKIWLCVFFLVSCLTACGEKKPTVPAAEPSPSKGGTAAAEAPSPTEALPSTAPSARPTEAPVTPTLPPVPPGTLPEVDSLPKADTSLVGTTCTLRLLDVERQRFAYYYDAETGRERLVTVPVPPDKYIPEEEIEVPPAAGPLTVYETSLGGEEGLKAAMTGEIEATVLAVVNISYQEIDSVHCMITHAEEASEALRKIDLAAKDTASEGLGYYFGANDSHAYPRNEAMWQQLPNGQYLILWEALEDTSTPNYPDTAEVFRRIYERFGLTELVLGKE